jgi:hypothetical protein
VQTKKLKKGILLAGLMAVGLCIKAQGPEVVQAYIVQYRQLAIAEMQRSGVPASIKLAQGILETTAGTSDLVQRSNNHFGIKCKSNWTGESVSHTDDAPNECFRKYPSPEDSYRDHSDFLKNNTRYAGLFKLDGEDYKGWAYGLKKAGYATSPRYPTALIKLIEEYNLQDYSLMALGKKEIPWQEWASAPAATKEVEPISAVQTEASPSQALPAAAIDPGYPEGEFRINQTRVIFAPAGTSLLTLAMKYDIPLKRLFEFNEMEEQESLPKAQLIYLQRKRKVAEEDYHIVREGESLYDIAQANGLRLDALLEYNSLSRGMEPTVGTRLALRKKEAGNSSSQNGKSKTTAFSR